MRRQKRRGEEQRERRTLFLRKKMGIRGGTNMRMGISTTLVPLLQPLTLINHRH
jgi:hypothetical protein